MTTQEDEALFLLSQGLEQGSPGAGKLQGGLKKVIPQSRV